jgi:LCP family protein required for cell wall assembly
MFRKLGIAVLAIALLAAIVLGIAWWQANAVLNELQAGPKKAVVASVEPELHRRAARQLVKTSPRPADEPKAQTLLVIGSDHRWEAGSTSRSDTILLARVDPAEKRIAILSIPRDLYVAIPGHGHDRINMAFAWGGEKLLTRTVRETFGVEIDHFVEVDFHGFKDLVSKLGGIWVPVDQRYFNQNVGTAATNYANIDLQPGYQKLDGQDALAFARYRHDDSDVYRASRQQLVIREALRETLDDKLDVLKLRRLAIAFAHATTSDISSLDEVWTLATAAHATPASRIDRLTVPGSDFTLYGADYLRATDAQMKRAVARWLGVDAKKPAAKPKTGRQTATSHTQQRVRLEPEGGRGAALLSAVGNGIQRCAPSKLPPGYAWPEGAARSYAIDGHPALALYATAGSGRSALLMETTWQDPPVLDSPTTTITRDGRDYDLWYEGGKLRQVAWRMGPTRAWLTNTLRDELSEGQLLGMAVSCR